MDFKSCCRKVDLRFFAVLYIREGSRSSVGIVLVFFVAVTSQPLPARPRVEHVSSIPDKELSSQLESPTLDHANSRTKIIWHLTHVISWGETGQKCCANWKHNAPNKGQCEKRGEAWKHRRSVSRLCILRICMAGEHKWKNEKQLNLAKFVFFSVLFTSIIVPMYKTWSPKMWFCLQLWLIPVAKYQKQW